MSFSGKMKEPISSIMVPISVEFGGGRDGRRKGYELGHSAVATCCDLCVQCGGYPENKVVTG